MNNDCFSDSNSPLISTDNSVSGTDPSRLEISRIAKATCTATGAKLSAQIVTILREKSEARPLPFPAPPARLLIPCHGASVPTFTSSSSTRRCPAIHNTHHLHAIVSGRVTLTEQYAVVHAGSPCQGIPCVSFIFQTALQPEGRLKILAFLTHCIVTAWTRPCKSNALHPRPTLLPRRRACDDSLFPLMLSGAAHARFRGRKEIVYLGSEVLKCSRRVSARVREDLEPQRAKSDCL